MCGIWGYIQEGDIKADVKILKRIIQLADERGGHGYGVFGVKNNGDNLLFKTHSRVDIDLVLTLIENCKIVVGHSRLATNSSIDLKNAQPIVNDGSVLVHNGNVDNHLEVAEFCDYTMITENDSEVMIPLIKQNRHLPDRFAYLILDLDKLELVNGNRILPLYMKQINGVTYYCSKNGY